MKRTSFFLAGLIGMTTLAIPVSAQEAPGLASSGAVAASAFTLDGTLEPDEIPGLARSADNRPDAPVYAPDMETLDVDGPSRLPKNLLERAAADTTVATARTPAAQPIRPPGKVSPSSHYIDEFETKTPAKKVAQVQYRTRGRSTVVTQQEPEASSAPNQETAPATEEERLASLQRSIKQVLDANAKRPLTTQHNSPGDLILMALPYGAEAKVYQPNASANPRDKSVPKGSYIYSIGSLCWNYSCNGKNLLRSDGSRVYARVGSGFQRRSGSFLALLAMSNIMPDYELKVDGSSYSIAHLIASEKASVSKGSNLSMSLVGLSFYSEAGANWKNELGEIWNFERMVTEELNRSIDQGSSDVTDWLLGLTAVVKLYEEDGKAIRGPMALAKKQVRTYQDFVLSVQNENNLWHPKFFLYKGTSPDVYETLYASGHILRWLILSLPENEIEAPKVRRAVMSLTAMVNRIPTNVPAGTMTDRQLESVAVSLQALSIYKQRVYGDDAPEEEPAKSPENQEQKSVASR